MSRCSTAHPPIRSRFRLLALWIAGCCCVLLSGLLIPTDAQPSTAPIFLMDAPLLASEVFADDGAGNPPDQSSVERTLVAKRRIERLNLAAVMGIVLLIGLWFNLFVGEARADSNRPRLSRPRSKLDSPRLRRSGVSRAPPVFSLQVG